MKRSAKCALKAKCDVIFTRDYRQAKRDEQTEIVDRIKSASVCRQRGTKVTSYTVIAAALTGLWPARRAIYK